MSSLRKALVRSVTALNVHMSQSWQEIGGRSNQEFDLSSDAERRTRLQHCNEKTTSCYVIKQMVCNVWRHACLKTIWRYCPTSVRRLSGLFWYCDGYCQWEASYGIKNSRDWSSSFMWLLWRSIFQTFGSGWRECHRVHDPTEKGYQPRRAIRRFGRSWHLV